MEDDFRLGHGAQHVAAHHLVAHFGDGGVGPLLRAGDGVHLHAAGQVVGAGLLDDLLQRALDAVVDVLDDAGAQLYAQGRAGGDHRRAGSKAGGLLIDLDGGPVAGHVQDLTDQALLAYADHVGHVGVGQTVGHHQGAGDLDDFSLTHSFTAFPFQIKGFYACRASRGTVIVSR